MKPDVLRAGEYLLNREFSARKQVLASLFLAIALLPTFGWLIYTTVMTEDLAFPSDQWVVIVVCSAFWLLGLLALVSAIHQMLGRRVAEPQVWIDAQTLHAGRAARLHVSLAGPARLEALSARLTCEVKTRREWRSQTTGTAKHSYVSTYPFEIDIPIAGSTQLARGAVLDRKLTFVVPAAAESTTDWNARSVIWRIEVRVSMAGWPDSLHTYRVEVEGQGGAHEEGGDEEEDEDEADADGKDSGVSPVRSASAEESRPYWPLVILGVVLISATWVYGRHRLLPVFESISVSAPSDTTEAVCPPVRDDDPMFAEAEQAFERRDYAAAHSLFSSLAERNVAAAQSYLGQMYDEGLGVPPNPAQAAIWYEQAAAQNHPIAENNLGVLYDEGNGVAKDYDKALALFRRAFEHGVNEAGCNVAEMYLLGKGVPKDRAMALQVVSQVRQAGGDGCPEIR